MPIFLYECNDCGLTFELLFAPIEEKPEEVCRVCNSKSIRRIISMPLVRMNSDSILRSVPDPTPPLEELRGKVKRGCEGGFADKPYADPQLKNYTRTKDKYGNFIWKEKRRTYYYN